MEANEEVICLDNYFTGEKQYRKMDWQSKFELIRHDVTQPIFLEVDRIWHLACPASPIHYQNSPIKTAKTSFLGTYNMLGLARELMRDYSSLAQVKSMGIEVHPQPRNYRGA